MVVAAPNKRNAHDDYCSSMGLAAWAVKGDAPSRVSISNENIYADVKKSNSTFYRERNRLTSRRYR
jgi:hypothetical protein